MRRSTVFFIFIASLVGVGLFQVKYEVMRLETQEKHLSFSIKNEEEAISILNAEWAHLTNPQRLQKLTEKHLDVVPVSPKQFVSWQRIIKEQAPPTQDQSNPEDRFALDQLVSNVLNDDSLGVADMD